MPPPSAVQGGNDQKPRKININVNEQSDRLKKLDQKKKENFKTILGAVISTLLFMGLTVLFWGANFGFDIFDFWIFKDDGSNTTKWIIYGTISIGMLALFLLMLRQRRSKAKEQLELDRKELETQVFSAGVKTYDTFEEIPRAPAGKNGVVTQVKRYKHTSEDGKWTGKVKFENGVFDCWSKQELTKGVNVNTVSNDGSKPQVRYDDNLKGLIGEVKNEFGHPGNWLLYFKDESKFSIGSSDDKLAQGMTIKVVTDLKPEVKVTIFDDDEESEETRVDEQPAPKKAQKKKNKPKT